MSSGMYVQVACLFFCISIASYCGWLLFGQKKKRPGWQTAGATLPVAGAARMMQQAPVLIDTVTTQQDQEADITFEQAWEEAQLELVEDEDSLLLKTAEKLVDEIQEIVTYHIASFPPNPEEVHSKLKAHLAGYILLRNTEYEDAINRFVAVTVQRDCELAFTEEQLRQLWA